MDTMSGIWLLDKGDIEPSWYGHIELELGSARCCELGHADPADAIRHTGERVTALLLADFDAALQKPESWASLREVTA